MNHWQDTPHDIVLCNFGGPTQHSEVEPFLIRLFEDPFIIRAPLGPLRSVLARRIAKKRAPNSATEYAHIGFSPINSYTDTQRKNLQDRVIQVRPNTNVHVVNRYTPPFAKDVVTHLRSTDARTFVLPLYPHFCHSTTASSLKDFDTALCAVVDEARMEAVKIFSWWHNPKFLSYCAAKVWEKLQFVLENSAGSVVILFSAHGIPRKYHERGDPYVNEIRCHRSEIVRRVNVWLKEYKGGSDSSRVKWRLSFQSRVGPVRWTEPYTVDAIQEAGREFGGSLLMVPISFTSDHIETLYEMDVTHRELALEAGFRDYYRVAAPNDDPEFADCLLSVLQQFGF